MEIVIGIVVIGFASYLAFQYLEGNLEKPSDPRWAYVGMRPVPVQHPVDPKALDFADYWLFGRVRVFHVGLDPFATGRKYEFKVVSKSRGQDDTIGLSEEEVREFVSSQKEI